MPNSTSELTSTKKSLALLEIEHSHIQEKLERKENELQYQMRILEEMERRMKQMVLTLANGGDEPRRGIHFLTSSPKDQAN